MLPDKQFSDSELRLLMATYLGISKDIHIDSYSVLAAVENLGDLLEHCKGFQEP